MSGRPGAEVLCGYGHSWVFGTGASRRDRGLAALAAPALGLAEDNRAESGSLSADTARLVAASPPPPARVFLLMTGLNDARRYGDSPAARRAYADALEVLLRAFRRTRPAAAVLAVEQPAIADYAGYAPFDRASDAVLDAYNAALRQVAARCGAVPVVAVEGWAVDTMIAADGVHPNDAGHRHLARAVVLAAAPFDRLRAPLDRLRAH